MNENFQHSTIAILEVMSRPLKRYTVRAGRCLEPGQILADGMSPR